MTSVASVVKGIREFSKLERILAAVCVFTPLLLVLGDNFTVRDSISAYFNMEKSVLFYVPLTVTFMLFLVNGMIKGKTWYNTALGVALAGLVLFNCIEYFLLHFIFAALFFLGNAAVIVIYTPKKELWFKIVLVAVIALSLGAWLVKVLPLFWAEWISLSIIALHYLLESAGVIE
ncbi:MAG: hypothetical protein JW863_04740 [Chitinispirillaceae bacterium]|nr:hypothetical protein [Chitinispirillaceae bacterium]